MSKKEELKGSDIDIPVESDIAAGMVSKGGIIDLTDKHGAESKEITGKKKEGVDPGLLTNKGMLKLGKNLLSIKPTNHHSVLEELLGIGIAKLFGFPVSEMKLVLVKTSIHQLTTTPEKGKLAEYKNEETILVPALQVNFNRKAKKLGDAKAIAAIHENYCSGYTQPVLEGINSNQILGEGFGLFGMLNFIFQDPDSMGKEGQNKMLLDSRLFIIDSGLKKTDAIEMREDGTFFNSYYKQFNSDSKLGWGRHLAFRNLSMIDDTPFIDKLQGAIQIINKKKEIFQLLDSFAKQIIELQKQVESGSDCHKILEDYQNSVNQYKVILDRRTDSLENTFRYYINIEKQDKNLLAPIVALEQLLSKSSRMYSRSGVPLRAVEIPYEDHFFCRGKLDWSSDSEKIIIKKLNQKEAEAVFAKMRLLLGEKVKLENQTITCAKEDFIKYVTEDRVRLLTHPETVSLKTALADENKDIKFNFFKNYSEILVSFPKLKSRLDTFLRFYNQTPRDAKDFINNLKVLRRVSTEIDARLPKDLLTKTTPDLATDWGSLVALKMMVTKRQQLILSKFFMGFTMSDGKTISIADLFAHADRLDIAGNLNELLRKAVGHPDLLENNLFNTVISAIIITSENSKEPGQNYEDFKRRVGEINVLMTDLITSNEKKPESPSPTGRRQSAETVTSQPVVEQKSEIPAGENKLIVSPAQLEKKPKIPLGIKDSASRPKAKDDISVSVTALTQGLNIYSSNSPEKAPTPVAQTEQLSIS
jgi:hypothetical protein